MIDRLSELQKVNPHIDILSLDDPSFRQYGIVYKPEEFLPEDEVDVSASPLLAKALELFNDCDGTSYEASNSELEACPEIPYIKKRIYGESPIQAGCCWGHSTQMKGMEYHRSSELLGAATEMVLILGRVQEIENGRWDSYKARFFYLPAGVYVELFSTTLHLAPNRVDDKPFCAVIILPQGTNTPLEDGPDRTLWMKNKWMLAHPEGPAAAKGAYIGIDGENWEIKTLG